MKRRLYILVGIVLAGAIASGGWSWFSGHSASGIPASGTLEARNITVGSKIGGRVKQVLVREGDHVEANQLL
jgi:membrane fusion protein YbhG